MGNTILTGCQTSVHRSEYTITVSVGQMTTITSPAKFYAGIGSRGTPQDECEKLTRLASILEKRGYTLRSGGAEGADKAFEFGVTEIARKIVLRPKHATKAAEEMASKVHPMWSACNEYVRKLHGRNAQIVFGENLDSPVDFVLAWTLNPLVGGTSLGINLAKRANIKVFNLAKPEETAAFVEFLSSVQAP